MKKIILCSIPLLLAQCLSAQTLSPTVISSSGAFYASATAMLSTTIGEMTMVETFASPANFLTQGFQQPEDWSVNITSPETGVNMFTIYPNPAADVVTIRANFSENGNLIYYIYNVLGQEVMNASTVPTQGGAVAETINVKKLSPGIYFIKADFISDSQKKQTYTHKLTIQK